MYRNLFVSLPAAIALLITTIFSLAPDWEHETRTGAIAEGCAVLAPHPPPKGFIEIAALAICAFFLFRNSKAYYQAHHKTL